MRSPHSLRNGGGGGGGTPSPHARIPTPHHHFHSTVSVQKLKRFNSLILVFRLSTFCFSLASAVFMITNSRGSGSDSPRWYDFDAFRYVFAANAIVAVYSLFEMIASVWEISREVTLFPEILQVWFDFGHDQAFAYLLLSADSAGTALAITLKGTDTCKRSKNIRLQNVADDPQQVLNICNDNEQYMENIHYMYNVLIVPALVQRRRPLVQESNQLEEVVQHVEEVPL
ncbi:CASP-like protein 4C1 isoform X1 [Cucumis melo]|uniref:CASP-like protein n=1 Tax=Cucumis melo TaxID=3656 RepID=A0A1S3CF42_CUCME|nr:CASP-like protein 4C1 isoform X1 [Cucumis melo]